MITMRKLLESDYDLVSRLAVNYEQTRYVGTVKELLNGKLKTWNYHVIIAGVDIVGFFNIDTGYPSSYSFTRSDELGLRAFFIGSSNQGKGYGKAAAMELKPYLVREYSSYSSIALTVNCNNPAAYKCYLGAGFEDTGALYQGEKAGPQHIMRMELPPANKNFLV